MVLGKEKTSFLFKWHFVILYIAVIGIVLVTIFTDVFQTPQGQSIPTLVWVFGGLVLLIAVIAMLAKLLKIAGTLERSGSKLDKIAEALEKNRLVLTQIQQNVYLSESAKTIAHLDTDMQALREAVFEEIQRQDFDSAYKVIDQIAQAAAYRELAEQLRSAVERYRQATDQERENQVIAHIDKLLDEYQWTKASTHIERLIKSFPESEKAKAMRQKLIDKKEERKKILLNAWDDAVKRQATDRSLEILRELDMYLTPNEGLALQEAARDIFRTKLHNLGVQFSLAVSGKQWAKALKTGQQIIRDFPNSKMAQEIREKIEILKQRIQQ